MEYQIQKTIVSEHQLLVEGELFVEKKEFEAWSNPGSEDLHGEVRVSHSRQIGDDKFFKICQTVDKDGGELIEEKVETNLENEEEENAFKSAWESGWQPTFNQDLPSDGFFASLKKSLKFW